MEPLFSVIIPTYNRADILIVALDSLVAQTYKNFEVIVCDDGSTDNTNTVAEDYKGKLDLTYIWEENWGGPARPRNNGIKASKGDWICFLDSDDWWYPEKLEICHNYIDRFNFIYHGLDAKYSNGKNKQMFKGRTLFSPIFEDLLINQNAITNSGACVRKEVLLKVNGYTEDPQLIAVEDFDLWLRISKITEKFKYITFNLGEYTISDFNTSRDFEKQIQRLIKIYDIHTQCLSTDVKNRAYATLNYLIAKLKFKGKKYSDSLSICTKAFPYSNYSIKLKIIYYMVASLLKGGLFKRSS